MTATAFQMPTTNIGKIKDPDLDAAVRERAEARLQMVPSSKRNEAASALAKAIDEYCDSGVSGTFSELVDACDSRMGLAIAKLLPKRAGDD